ncbi:MAG: hypothetical protein H8E31_13365 [Planctomycetes bacterium]|nr:hypothetical protein [Planctomycetota bacterium]
MGPEPIPPRLDTEEPKKCSLTPLRPRRDPPPRLIRVHHGDPGEGGGGTPPHPAGAPLSAADAGRPLLLVDSSWRDLPRVLRGVRGRLHLRSLPPGLRSAYPRRSSSFPDPLAGLASVEALHAACALLGRRDDSLLDGYHWREAWLEANSGLLRA